MLRRLTIGLFTLAFAAAIAACSSGNTTVPSSGGVPGVGPNLTTNTIYVSDTTQNAIDMYTPSPGPSATPLYAIGGSNTTLNGPAYLAFDSSKRLYVSNFSAATQQSSVLVFQTFATGNVLPFGTVALTTGAQPHGVAVLPNGEIAVAVTQPGAFFSNALQIYSPLVSGTTFLATTIAGSNTGLSNPIGVAADSKNGVYAANSGNATITVYAAPTPPTPTTSPSATPSPTPTATSTASGSPSPSPTPASVNLAPSSTITCSCFNKPTGLGIDSAGDLLVTDPGVPAVYVFTAAQIAPGGALALTPSRTISGAATLLADPTDVKTDSAGTIYVVDAGTGPNTSKLLIFSAAANGNVAPGTAIALPPGTATGLALSP